MPYNTPQKKAAWRKRNPEKQRAYTAAWRNRNPESYLASRRKSASKRYYAKHPNSRSRGTNVFGECTQRALRAAAKRHDRVVNPQKYRLQHLKNIHRNGETIRARKKARIAKCQAAYLAIRTLIGDKPERVTKSYKTACLRAVRELGVQI
jgi:hypothetical protein